jgi:hypothetical protein
VTEPVDLDAVLRRVAAGEFPTELPDIPPLDNPSFSRVLDEADATSLVGRVFHAWRLGLLPLTPDQRNAATRTHLAAMRQTLQIEQRLIASLPLLDAAGIDYRLLKGVALAHACYPDPATRSFVDADVLIAPGQMSRAVQVLTQAGGRRNIPELYPGHDDRFAKSVTVLIRRRALDLHRTLLAGPFGVTVPIESLFERSTPVSIGGRVVPALDTADLYIHAAVTAGVVDVPPRLVTFCDMRYLELSSGFSPDDVRRRSTRYGLAAAVARGIRLQQESLRLSEPPSLLAWAVAYRPAWRERTLAQTYLGSGRSYRRTLATLSMLGTWRERIAFARAIAMPATDYRAARTWTRRDHVARAYRKLLGR